MVASLLSVRICLNGEEHTIDVLIRATFTRLEIFKATRRRLWSTRDQRHGEHGQGKDGNLVGDASSGCDCGVCGVCWVVEVRECL